MTNNAMWPAASASETNAPPVGANDEGHPQHREFPDWPLEELRTKKGTADLYRMVYGPLSAQWIMPQLGFPTPPRELVDLGRQLGLALEGLPPHPQSCPGAGDNFRG
jgi:hypothetical protein